MMSGQPRSLFQSPRLGVAAAPPVSNVFEALGSEAPAERWLPGAC